MFNTHIPSKKQVDSINNSNSKINIWEGAVRSGKTYASLLRFLKEITYGPDGEYAMIAKTYGSFRKHILRQLFALIGKDPKFYAGRQEIVLWGKTIHLIGAADERAEAKIRGCTFVGAYVDEATIIPESVFKMLISRCAMGNAKIFATTNPDSPYHWLRKDYLEGNPDVSSWEFKLDDNPALSKEDKDYLNRQYTGLWHQRFIEGRWVQAEGSIYDHFDDKRHVIDFSPNYTANYIVGIDYGTTNPCAFVLIGVDYDRFPNIWVQEEYYFDSKIHHRQKTDSEYADDFVKFIKGKAVSAIYLDPSAVSFRLELQRRGIVNLYEAKNEVIDGIREVSDMLNNGMLKVCRSCPNLISEFQSYVWDPKCLRTGEDKPLKQNDHSLDALRYALYTSQVKTRRKGMKPQDLDDIERDAKGYGNELPRWFQDPRDYPGHHIHGF